ncbi:hypothetical protein [Salinarimonas sp.]|uniref:hypothetical protein n=1 Tax=Salinarimonas sp. TaxID=2766526 RepID=UPI0032D96DEB
MRLIATTCGTHYHIETFEGDRAPLVWDVVVPPERLAEVLHPEDTLFVPCRSPAQRLIAVAETIRAHLDGGGAVVAMGESRSDLWLPHVAFTPRPTNWWWWLEPGAELGVEVTAPDHPLLADLEPRDVIWHLHGHFDPPAGSEVLVRDAEGRALLYVDTVSTNGRMVVTSLDPCFHHGSHFMPATTRFLAGFLPALGALVKQERSWTRSPSARTART